MDHDQRFKVLLQVFFAEFLRLFFPAWAERFETNRIEWLQQEVFLDPPQGRKRFLDLVAKLPIRQPASPAQAPTTEQEWLALVHVEIEHRDTVEPLRAAMFDLYKQLRQRHQLPVLPMALYLRVGLEGVGWDVYEEHFWEHRLVQFNYAYVGLPALEAEDYLRGESILGVALAVLMRVAPERRAELAAQALQRVADSGENDYRRFLLAECVQAYAGLDETQRQQFGRLLATEPYRGAQTMMTTAFEKGIQQGIQQGARQELCLVVQTLLEKKFGPLSPVVRERVEGWTHEKLREALPALLDASSLRDLGLEE
jgi:hypothetical protein